MFGLSKAAVTYAIAAILGLFSVGMVAYQAWKTNKPPVAIRQTPTAPISPQVAKAPEPPPLYVPPGAILSDPVGVGPQAVRTVPPASATTPPAAPQTSVAAQVPGGPAQAAASAPGGGTQSSAQTSPQNTAAGTPEFDVVRVEAAGGAVVAGRAVPNSKVVLLNKGQEIASVQSDAAGNFVILPPDLPPGDHILALGVEKSGARVESAQNVTVSVPARGGGNALVALAEPDKPTRILSDPVRPATPAAGAGNTNSAQAPVSFRTVEADEGGGFFATGSGAPGSTIRLYLNDIPVATVTVGADRQWSLKIERGMTPGAYRVRGDQIDAAGNVLARAEVPFDYPDRRVASGAPAPLPPVRPADIPALGATPNAVTVAGAPAGAAPPSGPSSANANSAQASAAQAANSGANVQANPLTPASAPAIAPATPGAAAIVAAADNTAKAAAPATSAANAVVAEIQTVTVVRGDNLWRISRKMLGQGTRYTQIYEANLAQIRDPKLIYPNQIFVVPGAQPN